VKNQELARLLIHREQEAGMKIGYGPQNERET
jgi:hypothetical protein